MPKVKQKSNRGLSGERVPVCPDAVVPCHDMSLDEFKLWTAVALKTFLSLRRKSIDGSFDELVARYIFNIVCYHPVLKCLNLKPATFNFIVEMFYLSQKIKNTFYFSVTTLEPKEIHFFCGSKLLLPGARPGSKTNFVVAKLYVHFSAMKIY